MSKVVSIVVGIRNLSFCYFLTNDAQPTILKWDNIDLTEKITEVCRMCNKPVKYMKNGDGWCLKHSKQQPFIVMPKELTTPILNKTKVAGLKGLIEKYIGNNAVIGSRTEMITQLSNYSVSQCFESKTKINACHLNLVVIGRNIQHKLDLIFGEDITTITTVIIENQIGPLATKMKTVQGMLAQYFIMKNNNIQIEFISASNKLKGLSDEKSLDYKGRKKMGVQCCASKIEGTGWDTFFKSHKKKDDLADCFLQGLWYIRNKTT